MPPFRQAVSDDDDNEDSTPEEQSSDEKPQSLATKAKAKWPQYAHLPDADVEKAVIAKFPQYARFASTPPEKSLGEKAIDAIKAAGSEIIHPKPFKATGSLIPSAFKQQTQQVIDRSKWDKRSDGSDKGDGYLGLFKLPNGYVASEYSAANSEKLKDDKGNYLDYPTLVPTLTREEVKQVLSTASRGGTVSEDINDKAEAYALKRRSQGLPIFATPGEERTDIYPEIERAGLDQPFKATGSLIPSSATVSRFLSGPSSEDVGGKQILGPGMSKIPGSEALSQRIRNAGTNTGNYWGGFLGSLASEFVPETAFDPRTAGVKSEVPSSTAAEELPIRRSVRDFPKLSDGTPQQDAVAISLTKEGMLPRTPAAISTETGIPKSSVRRTLSELKKSGIEPKKYLPLPSESPDIPGSDRPRFIGDERGSVLDRESSQPQASTESPTASATTEPSQQANYLQDFIKTHPDATMSDIGEFLKTVPPPNESEPPIRQAQMMREEVEPPVRQNTEPVAEQSTTQTEKPDFVKQFEAKIGKTQPQPATEEVKPTEISQQVEQPQIQAPTRTSKVINFLSNEADNARARIKARGTFSGTKLSAGIDPGDLADFAIIGATKIANGAIRFADWSAGMIRDFGESIRPHLRNIFAEAQSQHAEYIDGAVKKLFNGLIEAKGAAGEQQLINKAERAKRFAAVEGIKEEGLAGAAKKLAAMRGEFQKATPGEGLDLSQDETNMLSNVIHRSNLDTPEQIRAHSALFALLNGDRVPQPNELETIDKVFGKYLKNVSGPGASGKYDIGSDVESRLKVLWSIGRLPTSFVEAGEKLRKPDDFLTKLANFSTKTTRLVLGTHIPGTAVSIHGFNEAVRNALYGPNFSPVAAVGRLADATRYLVQPGKAGEFLAANLEDMSKAVEEGGLRTTTQDIGTKSLFSGNNFVSRGINYVTDPKALFDNVIPALKLKQYNKLVEHFESNGMKHEAAAQLAGRTTNNIYGGLNWKQLQVSPTTVKLMRASLLAPDWLTSNALIGKETFNALKNPSSPQAKIYAVGVANFLSSYIALNAANAMANDGKFMFQNPPGHELDVAIGKDSVGRVRYWSPYGTATDMIRVPLEIAHSAVGGNMGETAELARSRASEPVQFMTDLATNTDYAGRALYDKTKYGKPIPPSTQGLNIASDAASHFLPLGAESGLNLAQGKVSPEQFAAQVLQAPMRYRMPDQPKGRLLVKKRKLGL